MTVLNAARRAVGLGRQGLSCSPVVVTNTMRQLAREIGQPEVHVPKTLEAFNAMLANNGKVGEKLAMASFDEIETVRGQVQQLQRDAAVEQARVQVADADDGVDLDDEQSDGPRPA